MTKNLLFVLFMCVVLSYILTVGQFQDSNKKREQTLSKEISKTQTDDEKSVSLCFENKPLVEVLALLEEKHGISWVSNSDILKNDEKVTINIKNINLKEATMAILTTMKIQFQVSESGVFMLMGKEDQKETSEELEVCDKDHSFLDLKDIKLRKGDRVAEKKEDGVSEKKRRLLDNLMEQKKFREAFELVNHMIKEDPNNSWLFFKRGGIFYSFRQYDKAVCDYSQAVTLCPNIKDYYFHRGKVLADLGDYKRALEDFFKSASFSPADPVIEKAIISLKEKTR